MSEDNTFLDIRETKPKLTSQQATLGDLKKHLILVFGSFKVAASAAGFSESRLHQLFMGYDLPKNPDTIKRIALGWNVDPVLLTQLLTEANLKGRGDDGKV